MQFQSTTMFYQCYIFQYLSSQVHAPVTSNSNPLGSFNVRNSVMLPFSIIRSIFLVETMPQYFFENQAVLKSNQEQPISGLLCQSGSFHTSVIMGNVKAKNGFVNCVIRKGPTICVTLTILFKTTAECDERPRRSGFEQIQTAWHAFLPNSNA